MRRLKLINTNSQPFSQTIGMCCLLGIIAVSCVKGQHPDKQTSSPANPETEQSTCPPNKPAKRPADFKPFGRGHHKIDVWHLIQLRSVREELRISDDEMKQLIALRSKVNQIGGSPAKIDWRKLDDEQKRAKRTELMELAAEKRSTFETGLKKILPAGKHQRIQQIRLQSTGIMALFQKDVSEALSMSEDQKSQIASVMKKTMHDAMRDYFQSGKKVSMREHMRETTKVIDKQVLEMLKPEQVEKFAELKGEPFEIDHEELRRIGRPSRRPGDGRRRKQPNDAENKEAPKLATP